MQSFTLGLGLGTRPLGRVLPYHLWLCCLPSRAVGAEVAREGGRRRERDRIQGYAWQSYTLGLGLGDTLGLGRRRRYHSELYCLTSPALRVEVTSEGVPKADRARPCSGIRLGILCAWPDFRDMLDLGRTPPYNLELYYLPSQALGVEVASERSRRPTDRDCIRRYAWQSYTLGRV